MPFCGKRQVASKSGIWDFYSGERGEGRQRSIKGKPEGGATYARRHGERGNKHLWPRNWKGTTILLGFPAELHFL